MPTFTVEQSTGPLARVKVGQLWPYGARLDLKLNAPAQTNETIRLEFYALSGSQPEPLAPAQES